MRKVHHRVIMLIDLVENVVAEKFDNIPIARV